MKPRSHNPCSLFHHFMEREGRKPTGQSSTPCGPAKKLRCVYADSCDSSIPIQGKTEPATPEGRPPCRPLVNVPMSISFGINHQLGTHYA